MQLDLISRGSAEPPDRIAISTVVPQLLGRSQSNFESIINSLLLTWATDSASALGLGMDTVWTRVPVHPLHRPLHRTNGSSGGDPATSFDLNGLWDLETFACEQHCQERR